MAAPVQEVLTPCYLLQIPLEIRLNIFRCLLLEPPEATLDPYARQGVDEDETDDTDEDDTLSDEDALLNGEFGGDFHDYNWNDSDSDRFVDMAQEEMRQEAWEMGVEKREERREEKELSRKRKEELR